MSFGDFIRFYNFYYDKHGKDNPLKDIMFPVKCLRNAAAHNNCVLNSLKRADHKDFSANKKVNSHVARIRSITTNSRRKCMAVPALHDFAALLMVYIKIVGSRAALKHSVDDLHEFLDRFHRHIDYYKSNTDITKTYIFFKNLLTISKTMCIIIVMFKSHNF